MKKSGRPSDRNGRNLGRSRGKPARGLHRRDTRDSSPEVQVADTLEGSERRYRLLAENISDVIWVTDTNLAPTYVSPSVSRLLGYSVEEVLGRTLPEFLTPASSEAVATAFLQVMEEWKRNPSFEPPPMEVELVRKDGSTVWVESNISPVTDTGGQAVEAVGVIHDITERKKAEQAVRESERLYRLLAENVSDVLFVSDINLRPMYISPSITRLLGFSVEEAEPRVIEEALTPESLPVAVKAVEELLEANRGGIGPSVSNVGQLKMTRKDGSTIWTEAEVSVLRDPDGHPTGLLGVIRDISKRKQAEEGLRESEEKYRQLVENINAVIYSVDENGVTRYISPIFKALFGTDPAELVGKRFAEFIHPDDITASMESFAKVMSGDSLGQPWECRMVLPGSGQTYWVQGHNRPVYRDGSVVGFQGVLVDISSRKQAEEALVLSEKKHRTLVEASPDGILSVDAQRRIVECNAAICGLLGYTKEEIKGVDIRQVATDSAVTRGESFTQQVERDGHAEAELEMVHHDGHTIPMWAKMVGLEGTKQGDYQILAYLRDMEERKKVDELKNQFIALVSHELRTPLTVVIGAVNTVLSEGSRLPEAESRHLLEDASSEADQLSHILDNLLELSRSQAERLTLQLEPVVLGEVARETVDKVRRHWPVHKFVIDLPGTLPPVRADRVRLERILYNLVENAAKYAPGGEVRVFGRQEKRGLVIAVHDQGPGIPREDQGTLFQPFGRIGGRDGDGIQGTGLGLVACRALVEAHGGKIWLESEPGQGTTFYFTLPIEARKRK